MNGVKGLEHSHKANGNPVKGAKGTPEQMQSLKIPEAVIAFAQAAARANGELKNVCQVSQTGIFVVTSYRF